MSLAKFTLRPFSSGSMWRMFCIRNAATMSAPPPAPHQFHPPEGEEGFLSYTRNFSRDKRYTSSTQPGNTPLRYLFRRLRQHFELYPLVGLIGFWAIIGTFTIWWSLNKLEVWIDKSTGNPPPWDWEKIRENYWKKPTLVYDPKGVSHRRLEIMEELEDEMLDAAKKRGTH